jgi:predicted nucleic acid-binding protein
LNSSSPAPFATIESVDGVAVRTTFGETTKAEKLQALDASAGSWRRRRFTGAEYVHSWVPVDEPIVRTAGLLARKHREAYSGIDDVAYLIAATALVIDAELLTTNVRHFPMLAGLRPVY